MAKNNRNTSAGGDNSSFPNTDWSQIHKAKNCDELIRIQIINNLIKLYWKPAYCYLRKQNCNNERAKDLAQGFFCDIVLDGKLIQEAGKKEGRFRDFMKVSLKNYRNNHFNQQQTQKRMPPKGIVSLNDVKEPELPQPEDMNAEQAFDYALTASFLDSAMDAVRQYYLDRDRGTHWQVFFDRVVAPIREAVEAPSLKGRVNRIS